MHTTNKILAHFKGLSKSNAAFCSILCLYVRSIEQQKAAIVCMPLVNPYYTLLELVHTEMLGSKAGHRYFFLLASRTEWIQVG